MGWIIKTIYDIVHNYGVAIILFTILIKMLLLPLNIKSQRAMKKQQKIQPVIAELQKKYANDQTKLQQEMMKIYKENNISMTGGCLPMLIQMPILIALYQAIRQPLTYMFNVPFKNVPENVINQVNELKNAMLEKFPEVVGNLKDMDASMLLNQYQINLSNWAERIYGTAHEWYINFDFFGLDLSRNPWDAFSYLTNPMENLSVVLLLIIPVLAVIGSVAQSKISMKMSGQDTSDNANSQAQSMSKAMTWMMPAMTAYFTLILPAGLGLYWIISSVVQIVQQIVLNNILEKKGEDLVVKVPEQKNQHGKKRKKR